MTLNKFSRIFILASAILAIAPAWAQTTVNTMDPFTDARTIPAQATPQDVSQTRIRFTIGGTEIRVRIADNPTSRDFVSMLPLTLDFSDLNAMEKISYLPRKLTTQGSTGRAPSNGDLIYFVPWGNLGFFYDIERRDASFDSRVIPIGTVETGYERLKELQTGPVRVERIL